MKDLIEFKRSQLREVARHRDELWKNPRLRWLFFEITNACNLRCRHCGSSCTSRGEMLSSDDVRATLSTIKGERPMVCLTGGEPMLHPEFFEIANLVNDMGFRWGMTTNGTLIDDEAAKKLREAGMATVSVSLDGLEDSHDALRGKRGAWRDALRGLQALKNAGFDPQVTSVFHRENFKELREMYTFLCKIGINDWRPINIEPIGRACESRDMLLDNEQMAGLISFIEGLRFDKDNKMNVTFGCSHFLGALDERMARDHYFLCAAGIITASVRVNGDISACLDIENRPELVQGNIKRDNFFDVWQRGFAPFRRDRTEDSETCRGCPERYLCGGDSAHTWDYDNKRPLLCYRDFGEALSKLK